MELGNFKKYIESFEDNYVFEYTLGEPFSWRGSYCEVAFSIENESSTKEDILEKILKAYNNTFRGYKGGEYKYNDSTDIHFDYDYSSYSGEGYAQRFIEDITGKEEPLTIEEKLIRLAFK